MITVDYIGGRGSKINSKNDYVILEQPLMKKPYLAPCGRGLKNTVLSRNVKS